MPKHEAVKVMLFYRLCLRHTDVTYRPGGHPLQN
jgi:hypothetical protein